MTTSTIASSLSHAEPVMLHSAPLVTEARSGETMVLADLRRGRYYTLNPVSSRVWTLLREGITLPVLLAQLHAEYDAPTERVDADVIALVRALYEAGLIVRDGADACSAPGTAAPAASPADSRETVRREESAAAAAARQSGDAELHTAGTPRGRHLRVPPVWRCVLRFLSVKLSLRVRGFGRTWRRIRERAEQAAVRDDVTVADIAATEYRIALVGAVWPGRALCLEQSLVLYSVLRQAGVGVAFRLGVQPHPFLAHAWVEYRGVPVNDVAEHVAQLRPMAELAQ